MLQMRHDPSAREIQNLSAKKSHRKVAFPILWRKAFTSEANTVNRLALTLLHTAIKLEKSLLGQVCEGTSRQPCNDAQLFEAHLASVVALIVA
mmetsp:Transcript_56074/g.149611  ORF Transcript_56074/g.149611 Transcript_56074/m.149611 type:complete len:93 (+) Transcript_56074:150-428(+)